MIGRQYCDITLKSLITEAGDEMLRFLIGGGKLAEWLNVELPQVRNPRVDLLARLTTGDLLHLELHGDNRMTPERMLEYGVGIWRSQGKFPKQLLVYLGNAEMRILNEVRLEGLQYRFEKIDIRALDGDAMAESGSMAVRIVSMLAGSRDRRNAIRRIMMKMNELSEARRVDALQKLFLLAGFRGLDETFEKEVKRMPVYFDIMDSKVWGPRLRKGIEEGRQQGLREGRQQALQQALEHERKVLRMQLRKRFGVLPLWAKERVRKLTSAEIERLALRLLDARNLEDVFA